VPTGEPNPRPPAVEPTRPGAALEFEKPAGGQAVKPVVAESPPKTEFDVDLYEAKDKETYESISQDYYNDKRYAAALQKYNRNKALHGAGPIELPPLLVLKKKYPTRVASAPGGSSGVVPSGATSADPVWAAPVRPVGAGRGTFVVSTPMTLPAVARQFGIPWIDLYNLNPQFTPDVPLPAGTELKMPAGAKP
jgi:hypothetical protein